MIEPKFMIDGYDYIGTDEKWHIKLDAPDWAKQEFKQFFIKISGEPDENSMVTQY